MSKISNSESSNKKNHQSIFTKNFVVNSNSKKKAFSLLEMSIVLAIIAVLVAGTIKGADLISSARLANARSLTNESGIEEIKGMSMWLETTSEESFDISGDDLQDGQAINKWNDINPKYDSAFRKNATQDTNSYQPKYSIDSINGLPSLSCDSNDQIVFDGSIFVQTNYTLFVVEKRADGTGDRMFLGGIETASDSNLHVGYRNNTDIYFGHYFNGLTVSNAVPAYESTSTVPRIHTFSFSKTDGKSYVLNGNRSNNYADTSQTTSLQSFDTSRICWFRGVSYIGNIGEIIVFSRALKIEEKQIVEQYLSKKWKIKLE